MNKLSLKWRLGVIAAIPFLFFAIISLQNTYQAFSKFREAKVTYRNIELVEKLSLLTHEMQVERGKSATFLNGGLDLKDLEVQKSSTDKVQILEQISLSSLSSEEKSELVDKLNSLQSLRAGVAKKETSATDAIKSYTTIVGTFLKTEKRITELAKIAEVKSALYSLLILEEAKESGGKLRANMAATLAKDAPIDEERFSLLTNLKGRVDANLASPALNVSVDGRKLLEEFQLLKEWQEVNRIYKVMLTKSEQGHYGTDPKEFFATITTTINFMNKIVGDQIRFSQSRVDSAKKEASASLVLSLFLLFSTFIGLTALSALIIRKLSLALQNIARELFSGSQLVATAAGDIASSSVKLSEASIEQAAALQETVASVDEINAMVGKNTEATVSSLEISKNSSAATISGKQAMDEMIEVIGRIRSSSTGLMDQVKDSNKRISEIVHMISEIGNKTKVINDIVFQTKLLSFNASVEAARAGEHGKGFSVVAEEVGKLAQMSGNAAKEISDLLGNSIERVEGIVKDTSSKMDVLLVSSDKEIKAGNETAAKCAAALEEIFKNVTSVDSMVTEIASASGEQAKGVQEVTKAMQQLDQVTQQNSFVSQDTADAATKLRTQTETLESVVSGLLALINGQSDTVVPDNVVSIDKAKSKAA